MPALTDPFAELTVFAPTDAAFTTFLTNSGITAAELLASPTLGSVLLYHVLGMEVMSGDLTNGPVATLNGADILVDITNGAMINDANVTLADVDADNGVVHAIDKVLIPGTASVEGLELNKISIYPNPTASIIKVENFENAEYKIINMNGKIVKNGTIESNTIRLESLNKGTYFLQIFDGEKAYTNKIVKK